MQDCVKEGLNPRGSDFYARLPDVKKETARRLTNALIADGLAALPALRPTPLKVYDPFDDDEPTEESLVALAAAILDAQREKAKTAAFAVYPKHGDEIPDIIDLMIAGHDEPAQACRYILKLWDAHLGCEGAA